MFDNTNQDFTFNNFFKYINNPELNDIGLYIIKVKKGCSINLVNDINLPEGPIGYKDQLITNSKNFNSIEKFNDKLNKSDDEILYIGSTPKGSSLKDRLSLYRNFGYSVGNTKIRHSGGKRIWFIKDNKNNLVIDYINAASLQKKCPLIYNEAEKLKFKYPNTDSNIAGFIEAGLLFLHAYAYNMSYPFANEKFECINTKDEWFTFWKNYTID